MRVLGGMVSGMSMMSLAGLFGLFGVALGAFGAHGLKDRVPPEMIEIWKTGVLYHLIHAVTLLALSGTQVPLRRAAGACWFAGIAIFSGTLYALVLTGALWLGAVTPVGGLLLMAGWLLVAVGGVMRKRQEGSLS